MYKCPKCKKWFSVPEGSVDYIHVCKEDKSIKRLKIFDDGWQFRGMKPIPAIKISKSDLEDWMYSEEYPKVLFELE